MLRPNQIDFLKVASEAAVSAERTTGCPAELSLAQAIVESAWGKVAPGMNLFGIKNTDRFPGCQYCLTKEYIDGTWKTQSLAFEVYPNLAACFIDHAKLLTDGFGKNCYSPHWAQYQRDHDLDAFIRGISTHYASDPGYAPKIITLAHGPNLTVAVIQARSLAQYGTVAHTPGVQVRGS